MSADQIPENIGKYQLRDVIGRGGMGVVYRAYDSALEREVAVKVIRADRLSQATDRNRFASEARALARLSSPHVVQVFDFHPDAQAPYLVMEFVRGRSLSALLRAEGRQPLRRVLDCAWQVLSGLVAAHAAGIIHRDIKPGNILLAADGVYKLADFGLALSPVRGDGEAITAAGEIVGTVRYLAPEVAMGGEAVARSDLYALGLSLYELASGKHPIPLDTNALAMARHIVNEAVPPLEQLLPHLPADLAQWFARMLAHRAADRFATASEALSTLDRIELPNEAITPTRRITAGVKEVTDSEAALFDATTVATPNPASRPILVGTSRPVTASIAAAHTGRIPAELLRKPRARFVIKLVLAIWVISSAASFAAGLVISSQAIAAQTVHFRKELATVAASAALLVDGDAHARLAAIGPGALSDPAFIALRDTLRRFKTVHADITYIYTMAQLPETATSGVVQFVCDASQGDDRNGNGVIDPEEEIAKPGQRYATGDSPLLLTGFNEPNADEVATRDQWGSWLSGYAPIRDAAGRSVGLVGVDLAAGHITRLESDFLWHSLALLASTLVAFLAAGLLVALRMRRPIVALQHGLLRVAKGDLDATVTVRSADEFRVLADSFNFMIAELRDAAAMRRAFEGFVARTLDSELNRQAGDQTVASGGVARLYCDIRPRGGSGDRQALGNALMAALPLVFDAIRARGGVPERVVSGGVLIAFPATSAGDPPQERAVRAALGLLAAVAEQGVAHVVIGIDAGDDVTVTERVAIQLGHANVRLGTDLLVSTAAFPAIRNGFYADRLALAPELGEPAEAFAVKGAVSA